MEGRSGSSSSFLGGRPTERAAGLASGAGAATVRSDGATFGGVGDGASALSRREPSAPVTRATTPTERMPAESSSSVALPLPMRDEPLIDLAHGLDPSQELLSERREVGGPPALLPGLVLEDGLPNGRCRFRL